MRTADGLKAAKMEIDQEQKWFAKLDFLFPHFFDRSSACLHISVVDLQLYSSARVKCTLNTPALSSSQNRRTKVKGNNTNKVNAPVERKQSSHFRLLREYARISFITRTWDRTVSDLWFFLFFKWRNKIKTLLILRLRRKTNASAKFCFEKSIKTQTRRYKTGNSSSRNHWTFL